MSLNKVTTRDGRGDSGKCKATRPDARKKAQDTSSKGSRMKELLGEIEKVLARKS